MQQAVKTGIAFCANDADAASQQKLRMPPPPLVRSDLLPRIHFIPQWAAVRERQQADIVRGTGADKSVVSRWFKGHLPSERYLLALASYFEIEVADLFDEPNAVWLRRFMKDRSADEIDRIKVALQASFPK